MILAMGTEAVRRQALGIHGDYYDSEHVTVTVILCRAPPTDWRQLWAQPVSGSPDGPALCSQVAVFIGPDVLCQRIGRDTVSEFVALIDRRIQAINDVYERSVIRSSAIVPRPRSSF